EGYAQTEGRALDNIIQANNGKPLGEKPLVEWFEKRNKTDELEIVTSEPPPLPPPDIAANWSDVAPIYTEVVTNLKTAVPVLMVAPGHASHSYDQETNIYFMLGAMPEQNLTEVRRVYDAIWRTVVETTLEHNGTICHHHGIGKVRAEWVPKDLGSSYQVLEKIKQSLDPNGIMNQGTLIPK